MCYYRKFKNVPVLSGGLKKKRPVPQTLQRAQSNNYSRIGQHIHIFNKYSKLNYLSCIKIIYYKLITFL